MNQAGTVRRARVRIGCIAGAIALTGGLAACIPQGVGHGHPTTTTTSPITTTTSPTGPTCAPKTQIIGGYPVAVTLPTPGWYSSDTRENGSVSIDSTYGDPSSLTCNAVVMKTGAQAPSGTSQDKAQLYSYNQVGTLLTDINTIGYSTFRSSLSTAGSPADAAINIQVTGGTHGFATLVYEPYNQSTSNGGVTSDTWQTWDATATTPGDGVWWSSKITSGAGSQSLPIPWAQMQAFYTGAVLGGVGVNIGSNNPGMFVAADNLTIGAVTTDF